jgi:hypothetical protein
MIALTVLSLKLLHLQGSLLWVVIATEAMQKWWWWAVPCRQKQRQEEDLEGLYQNLEEQIYLIAFVRLSSDGKKLPGRTPQPETISSDMSASLGKNLLLYSRELGESPINNKCKVLTTSSKVDTSHRPKRKETLDHKNSHGSAPSLAS